MSQKRMLYFSKNPAFVGTPQKPVGVLSEAGFLVPMLDCPKHGVKTVLDVCYSCPNYVAEGFHFVECSLEPSKQQMDQAMRAAKKAPPTPPVKLEVPEGVFKPE